MNREEARALVYGEIEVRKLRGRALPVFYDPKPRDLDRDLTPRQEKVVQLFCRGLSFTEIGKAMGLGRQRPRQLLLAAVFGGRF